MLLVGMCGGRRTCRTALAGPASAPFAAPQAQAAAFEAHAVLPGAFPRHPEPEGGDPGLVGR